MPILETVIINHNTGYTQGVFANDINRNQLYNDSILVSNNRGLLMEYLYRILMWGDFDRVVGRYKRTTAIDILNNINDFETYSMNFFEILENQELSITQKFNYFKRGELRIRNVGFAYFTKILHFYSVGNNQAQRMLILDKWLIFAWASLIIERQIQEQYEILGRILRVKDNVLYVRQINGTLYTQFNNTMQEIADNLGLEIQRFEELIFGWDRRVEHPNFNNPRFEILDIIQNNLNLII
jgi:hypothetical protein